MVVASCQAMNLLIPSAIMFTPSTHLDNQSNNTLSHIRHCDFSWYIVLVPWCESLHEGSQRKGAYLLTDFSTKLVCTCTASTDASKNQWYR